MGIKRRRRRPLTIHEIVSWASGYREMTGKFPTKQSGPVAAAKFETWVGVDRALREGLRGLPGGSSLALLLEKELGARHTHNLPPLTESEILRLADAHLQQHGRFPIANSGVIPDSGGDKWRSIDMALRKGSRGLAGGSSLARLLAQHRGVRNRKQLPALCEEQVLEWADAGWRREGAFPTSYSGAIADVPGETWLAVDMALRHGHRGLPGGSSLAFLLADKRGVRNVWTLPKLTIEQVLAWCDAWHDCNGTWPHIESGLIPGAQGETWTAVNHALIRGSRGLPGGSSVAKLLAQHRGVRSNASVPKLTRRLILVWSDAHYRRHNKWPTSDSGPIPEASGESWQVVDTALRDGLRGLRAGSSLARLLAERRNKINPQDQPRLSHKKVLAWCDACFARTGRWPNVNSGAVQEAPTERWDLIDDALRQGCRGLAGGSSLRQLLTKKRGVRNPARLPPLTVQQIVEWAHRHRVRTGSLPKYDSGPVLDAAGESWAGLDYALRHDRRGLRGESSLARLLARSG